MYVPLVINLSDNNHNYIIRFRQKACKCDPQPDSANQENAVQWWQSGTV